MPTISINQKDFEQLVGRPTIAAEPLDAWLPLVKAELKDQDSESGEVRVELHDSNRPDLWSCEGIARQIRIKLQGAASAYPFFKPTPRPKRRIQVMQGLERVRPYIAACTAVGYRMTGEGLAQLVQTQEKLADIFGRKRRTISIGLYRLPQIVFPVTYTLVKPEEVRFTPLAVEEAYPYATELGKTVRTPFNFQKARSIPIKTIEDALGVPLGAERIRQALLAYGYEASASKDRGAISVKIPPYRNDLMHPLDVVEDVAISRGYGEFTPIMPSQFTVGNLSRLEEMSDRVRDMMVGMGFQEIISNIMASRQELIDRMRLAGSDRDQIVEVENVMTQAYSCLRQWITPSLLRVEAASTRAFYPHRLFEVGEVAVPDATEETGVRTLMVLGALIAHANGNFSEAHSCLDLLLFYLDRPYTLEPISHRSFLDGRAGRIVSNGRAVGLIGEIHPEVLEHWQVSMPSVVFELEVDALVNEGKS